MSKPTARESNITRRVVEFLSKVPDSWVRKMHAGAYQGKGVPDVYFTCAQINGRSVWLEVKRPGEVPTPIQAHEMKRLDRAGAITIVVTSVQDVRDWLNQEGIHL